jgi:hypothetical protein
VFENRVQRRIFEEGRKWREGGEDHIMRSFVTCTLHQNIIRAFKSRRMRWAGHVTCMRDMRNAYNVFVRKPEGKNNSEELCVDGRILLEWI